MENFAYEMVWLVEKLTSGYDSHDSVSRDPSRELNIPDHVMDLAYFGRAAGEAVPHIADGNMSSIDMTCPTLSRLAALVTTQDGFHSMMHDMASEAIAHIVDALGSQKVAAHWDGATAYQDIILTITWLSVMPIPRDLHLEATVGAMVNALENFDELSLEAAKFALNYMDIAACGKLDCFSELHMNSARDNAISIVGDFKDANDAWRTQAIDALSGIDFKSEIGQAEKHEEVLEELNGFLLAESDPQNIAITTAWLAAIYLYTEYGERIADHFDIEILEVKTEDHQEDTVASPDGLAA